MAGAGIGHAQQVQRGLDAAVLAVLAVEAQKHQIRRRAQFQHMGPQPAGTLVLAAFLHRLQIRSLDGDGRLGAQTVRRIEEGVQIRRDLFQPQEHIHQNRPVSVRPQRPAHTTACYQGDRPLRGQASRQNNDLHLENSYPFHDLWSYGFYFILL